MSDFNDNAENKCKLFVGNLPWSMSQDAIADLFAEFGEIKEVSLITDRMTGRSKGFAFVEFVNEEDANKAVEGRNGFVVEERELVVNVARPRAPRDNSYGRRDDRRSFGGGRPQNRDRRY